MNQHRLPSARERGVYWLRVTPVEVWIPSHGHAEGEQLPKAATESIRCAVDDMKIDRVIDLNVDGEEIEVREDSTWCLEREEHSKL